MSATSNPGAARGPASWLRAEPGEWAALAWSVLYFAALIGGYYVMRPVRDAVGATSRLEWLFTATFVCMLAIVPLYGAVVSRYARRTFLPIVYGFFIACLVVFHFAFANEWSWRGPAFFVWVAVFNQFIVSVFWSFMADVFEHAQAKRLYGYIAAGGTIGGLLGPLATAAFVEDIGVANLLLVSATLLGVCLFCVTQLAPYARARERRAGDDGEVGMGGGIFGGIRLIRESKILQAFCVVMFFGVGVGTLLYNEQAAITRVAYPDVAARTGFYARIDLAINTLTLVVQVFVTRWLLTRFGVGFTMLVPVFVVMLGFAALTASPLPILVAIVQVVTRSGEFSVNKPARETIYSLVDRESRYKSKNFIDTVVYRGGDLSYVWLYTLMSKGLALGSQAIFALGIVTAGGWLVGVLWLIRSLPTLTRASPETPGEGTKP